MILRCTVICNISVLCGVFHPIPVCAFPGPNIQNMTKGQLLNTQNLQNYFCIDIVKQTGLHFVSWSCGVNGNLNGGVSFKKYRPKPPSPFISQVITYQKLKAWNLWTNSKHIPDAANQTMYETWTAKHSYDPYLPDLQKFAASCSLHNQPWQMLPLFHSTLQQNYERRSKTFKLVSNCSAESYLLSLKLWKKLVDIF